jgi:DNA-binding NarL/FixJ family response regulator
MILSGLTIETNMIRLFIVADRPTVLKGLKMYFSVEPDILVIGEAATSEVAIRLTTALCPDIVLVDIDSLHADGIASANAIHLQCPDVSLVIISIHDNPQICERAKDAGAVAFVTKALPAEALLAALRQVKQGQG